MREVLRCILHTICFNRALGLVSPRDVDSELFDVTYVSMAGPCPRPRTGTLNHLSTNSLRAV